MTATNQTQPPPIRVRGVRQSLPSGYMVGRVSAGSGPAELIPLGGVATALSKTVAGAANGQWQAGKVTSLSASFTIVGNTLELSAIGAGDVLGNSGTVSATPTATGLSALLDVNFGKVEGDILYRGASAWLTLAASTTGLILQTNSTGAAPSWVSQNWTATDVSAIGTGLTITSGTLAATGGAQEWQAGTVTSLGTNISIVSDTLEVAQNFNVGTVVTVLGTNLSISSGTLNASGGTSEWTAGTVTSVSTSFTIASDVLSLQTIASGDVLGNTSTVAATPVASTLTALLDLNFGKIEGDILYRNGSAWVALPAGTSGQFLQTQGTTGIPQWANVGAGSQTNVIWNTAVGMPALSGFTQVGISGNTSIAETSGVAFCIADTGSSSLSLRGVYKAVPGSTPYRVAILLQNTMPGTSFAEWAFGWTDGTKYNVLSVFVANGSTGGAPSITNGLDQWSTSTTRSSTSGFATSPGFPPNGLMWVGLRDDGTAVHWEYSTDGVNFVILQSVTKSSGYLGSSGYANIFFGIEPDSSSPSYVTARVYDVNGLTRAFQ